jgi:hypothetical protein
MKPFHVIYEAEWNDIVCVDYPLTPEKYVKESIQPLINTHVDTLFYNLCSSDAYCCGLENGEILCDAFDPMGDAWVWRYRENVKALLEADANPPDIACEYGHRLGMKVIPVVRMNDMHDMFYKYEVSQYKLDNPHLLLGYGKYQDWEKGARGHPDRKSLESFTWGMFDFAHEEVREHRFAIIEEFITRWDNDGMSLDFDRDPWFFKEQGKPENAAIMTDLIRRVRKLLDEVSRQRGRPQYLHVRVIPPIDTCLERGLDVRTWVEEGLVDAITPGCGYMTITQDITPWLELVEGKPCWIYPSTNHWKSLEVTRAWAKQMWQKGAHGALPIQLGPPALRPRKGNTAQGRTARHRLVRRVASGFLSDPARDGGSADPGIPKLRVRFRVHLARAAARRSCLEPTRGARSARHRVAHRILRGAAFIVAGHCGRPRGGRRARNFAGGQPAAADPQLHPAG